MPATRWIAGLLAFGFAAAALSSERPDPAPGGFWWGGADIGLASLSRRFSVSPPERETRFTLALRGGYAWHPQLLLGVELSGWLLQADNSYAFWSSGAPALEGEGIQTLYFVAQYYPWPDSGTYLKAGYGNVHYWVNRLLEEGAYGHGGVLALGRDFAPSGKWRTTLAVELASGRVDGAISPPGVTQEQRYEALSLRVGFNYR